MELPRCLISSPKQDLLNDRIILVTGASDGIGREAAMTYARYGAVRLDGPRRAIQYSGPGQFSSLGLGQSVTSRGKVRSSFIGLCRC